MNSARYGAGDEGVEMQVLGQNNQDELKESKTKASPLDMNQEFSESMVTNLNKQKMSPRDNEQRLQDVHQAASKDGMKSARNKKTIYFLFFVVLTMNLLINFDHGVMPAGSVQLKEDLNLSNTEYGWLGSVVFIGLTLGKYKIYHTF